MVYLVSLDLDREVSVKILKGDCKTLWEIGYMVDQLQDL